MRHASEYIIRANGRASCRAACTVRRTRSPRSAATARGRCLARSVLVGGLGMGFTLRAALDLLPRSAVILVAELVPAVVEWNRGPLGALAQHPLDDPRVRIEEGDVAATMRSSRGRFDAVLLDVDNGPAALTASSQRRPVRRRGCRCRARVAQARRRAGGLVRAGRSRVRAAVACGRIQRAAGTCERSREQGRAPAHHSRCAGRRCRVNRRRWSGHERISEHWRRR